MKLTLPMRLSPVTFQRDRFHRYRHVHQFVLIVTHWLVHSPLVSAVSVLALFEVVLFKSARSLMTSWAWQTQVARGSSAISPIKVAPGSP